MKNPCGKYSGAKNPMVKNSGGKLSEVLGKKGTVKKFLIGK